MARKGYRKRYLSDIKRILESEPKIWANQEIVESIFEEEISNDPGIDKGTVKRNVQGSLKYFKDYPDEGVLYYEGRGYYHKKYENILGRKSANYDEIPVTEIIGILHESAVKKKEEIGETSFDLWLKNIIQHCVTAIPISPKGQFSFIEGSYEDVETYDAIICLDEDDNGNPLELWFDSPKGILSSLLTHPKKDIRDQSWKHYDYYRDKRLEAWKEEKYRKKKGGLLSWFK